MRKSIERPSESFWSLERLASPVDPILFFRALDSKADLRVDSKDDSNHLGSVPLRQAVSTNRFIVTRGTPGIIRPRLLIPVATLSTCWRGKSINGLAHNRRSGLGGGRAGAFQINGWGACGVSQSAKATRFNFTARSRHWFPPSWLNLSLTLLKLSKSMKSSAIWPDLNSSANSPRSMSRSGRFLSSLGTSESASGFTGGLKTV